MRLHPIHAGIGSNLTEDAQQDSTASLQSTTQKRQ
eukprot:CAMPEP_0194321514 /NCGR_PEP_ID=MMETSP0171-20130528/17717_1 /TAXON_ID=218684 /ORGANISM="Corethron pennatum, Strain L29A3" /LENGTH=34 /DNA_ID= /DNA_START= /DNA_END= /DNA_ORIENTATION=